MNSRALMLLVCITGCASNPPVSRDAFRGPRMSDEQVREMLTSFINGPEGWPRKQEILGRSKETTKVLLDEDGFKVSKVETRANEHEWWTITHPEQGWDTHLLFSERNVLESANRGPSNKFIERVRIAINVEQEKFEEAQYQAYCNSYWAERRQRTAGFWTAFLTGQTPQQQQYAAQVAQQRQETEMRRQSIALEGIRREFQQFNFREDFRVK